MLDGIKRQAGRVYLLCACANRLFIAARREGVEGGTVLIALSLLLLTTLIVVLLILRP